MSTKTCPQCGSAVLSQTRFCGQCGYTFAFDAVGADAPARRVPTTVDEATADPPAVAQAGSPERHAFAKTMVLGGAVADAPMAGARPTDAPGRAADSWTRLEGSDKRTMLGMPSIDLPQAPTDAAPAPFAPANKTMLGVAIPGIAPTHEPAPPAPGRAGTLLGVAVPGVAPSAAIPAAPGAAWAPLQAELPAPPIVPAPAPLVMEALPAAPRALAKKGVPAIAVVGLVFVLVVLIGVGATVLVMRASAPLTAQPRLDETGKESLAIGCASCPDGTVVSLGASSATVVDKTAVLPLPAPLAIGDNDLEMSINRPAAGRDETVKVHVPVAYRVKADLSTLTAIPPAVTVRVEATPGTEVAVDGQPVALDATGKGAQSIDVSAEALGPSDDTKAIDRKIVFAIRTKGAEAPERGELVVRAAVVPLHLDAPGREMYTDRATGNVAGQTRPGATVTIDGQSVALDAQGRFAVRVSLPTEGEKTIAIVANAPPLAPRTVQAKLVRVGSLEVSAKVLDAKGAIGFGAYGAAPASKIGQVAVVDGSIVEIRTGPGHTVMLVEEKSGCPAGGGACLVRVVHGEEVAASRGDAVRAYGYVEGTVTSGGTSVPDLEGLLVIVRPAGKKK